MPQPLRLLIVRLSALGDCVHVLPALDALRRGLGREARIGWLIEERAASLIAGHPQLDAVHVLPRKAAQALLKLKNPLLSLRALGGFFRDLRAEGYETAVDFHSNLRSSLAVLASGARERYGYAKGFCYDQSYLFRNRNFTPTVPVQHRVEKHLGLVSAVGVDPVGARAIVPVAEDARARAVAWLRERFPERPRVIAFHPGASSHTANKQWPTVAYAALAWELGSEGARAVVTWGPGERPLAEEIVAKAAALGTEVVLGPETRSLQDLAALYASSAAVVGSDTGPVHLAAALGTPVVGLYAPKDPQVYAPWSSRTNRRAEVVYKPEGIEKITPAEVRAALRRAIHA